MATPLASQYGRRPVYLLGNLIAGITNIVPGYCDTWATIMVTRAINGLTAGSVMAMGAATICDMYFAHQRGMFMGIYTLCLTNGSNVSNGPTALSSYILTGCIIARSRLSSEASQQKDLAGTHASLFQAISSLEPS